jgi:hypothetical protein
MFEIATFTPLRLHRAHETLHAREDFVARRDVWPLRPNRRGVNGVEVVARRGRRQRVLELAAERAARRRPHATGSVAKFTTPSFELMHVWMSRQMFARS